MPRIVLALVLLATLLLGRGLGHFYLSNMAEGTPEIPTRNVFLTSRGEFPGKKRVLRLNQVPCYTWQIASLEEKKEALKIGKQWSQKGYPVIITGEGPFEVLLGLVNQKEGFNTLEIPGELKEDCLNKIAFKFAAEDFESAEKIAPFLGQVSLCLEKGLFLYPHFVLNEELALCRPKFVQLADSLLEVAQIGEKIEEEAILQLVKLCVEWEMSLRLMEKEWTQAAYLKSQQQALVLLEEYHRFLKQTN